MRAIADEREALMWGFVNMLHSQVQRLDRTVDHIVPEMRDLERAQDGTEVKAWELQLLTDRARNLVAITGGKQVPNADIVWSTLDQTRAKHGDMVLLHRGGPGVEKVAASWAEARGVN